VRIALWPVRGNSDEAGPPEPLAQATTAAANITAVINDRAHVKNNRFTNVRPSPHHPVRQLAT
jgi:hypothetical protein